MASTVTRIEIPGPAVTYSEYRYLATCEMSVHKSPFFSRAGLEPDQGQNPVHLPEMLGVDVMPSADPGIDPDPR